jgi:hypothetical protein
MRGFREISPRDEGTVKSAKFFKAGKKRLEARREINGHAGNDQDAQGGIHPHEGLIVESLPAAETATGFLRAADSALAEKSIITFPSKA